MKYMLDIALILGLLWIGYLWNSEKQNGLAQGDEIDRLKANVARLELDLGKASEQGKQLTATLEANQASLAQAGQDLTAKTDALNAKTAEADELRTSLAAAVGRVKELEGYKAKAIVAEMPRPAAPPAP